MKCSKCGFENRPEARFCKQCGQSLSLPPESLEAHIEGVSGQVAIGDYNVQIKIGDVYGGEVNIALPEQRPRPRPRPIPVSQLPLPFPGLLDREAEIDTATTAIRTPAPVEFYGEAGIGKTVLLRHLAYHPIAASFSDGVVHLSVRRQPVEDLLKSLFDAFYESPVSFKPTETQVRQGLQGKRALILLDDVELAREGVEALMNAAPTCTFVIASSECHLWGEGEAIGLCGLPADDALALIERKLERPLTPEERPAAQSLYTALDGHPLRLLQAAAMAREEGSSLAEVAQRPGPLTMQMLDTLPKPEQRLLAVLAALGGAPVHVEHLTALTGLADAELALQALLRRGMAQAHSPRYSLTGTLGETLAQEWDLTPWAERALDYFGAWAEGQRQAPDRLLEEADAILRILEWAVGAGRWKDILRLGRAVEGALALRGWWAAWAQVLQWALQAAKALGDQVAIAWALHQLGTRALCLGDAASARDSLAEALRLREALGDQIGAAVTRHNLDILLVPPPPPRKPPEPPAKPPPPSPAPGVSLLVKGIIALVSVLLLVAGIVALSQVIPPLTETAVEEPTPTITPSPTVWVLLEFDLELTDGCDQTYSPGGVLQIEIRSNVDGWVDVYLVDPDGEYESLFREEVQAGRVARWDWDAPESAGDWALEAYLVGDQASDRCDFTIEAETTPPVIGEIWIEPLSDEPVCPEDEVYVYVQVSDESGVGSVELWTRYPAAAGSGSWVPAEMSAIGDQRYRYPLTAYEEPGTEFYVYAEDVYGNSARSDVQVYVVEHCPTVLYDFVAGADTAQWSHRYGLLPFPGDVDDDRGFALWQDDVHMEDGSREAFVLVTHPAWDDYDYVEGIYDQTQGTFIRGGDLFVARIGFLADMESGEVGFRLLFSNVCEFAEFYVELGAVHEFYDEEVQEWMLSLDEIAGQNGCFALRVESGEIPSYDDWATWAVARLERP